jgi:hypothetical protein
MNEGTQEKLTTVGTAVGFYAGTAVLAVVTLAIARGLYHWFF